MILECRLHYVESPHLFSLTSPATTHNPKLHIISKLLWISAEQPDPPSVGAVTCGLRKLWPELDNEIQGTRICYLGKQDFAVILGGRFVDVGLDEYGPDAL
ncbi:MAG: hypothetical protein ACI8W8_002371 [Rhodothermales bacterium]|jgi:hypothetical protein